jgi:CheY-like chemotaxis protein
LNLLVIEDDARLASEYRGMLEKAGHRVTTVGDGLEALAWLDENRHDLPDLIVLDLSLPVLDGAAFRREQLKCRAYARIPVVVMPTGFERRALPSYLASCDQLLKPAPASDLVEVVRQFGDLNALIYGTVAA